MRWSAITNYTNLLIIRSLIAIMLCYLEMDVSERITAYRSIFKKVFKKERGRIGVKIFKDFGDVNARFDSFQMNPMTTMQLFLRQL